MIKWEEPECINPIECIEEGGCMAECGSASGMSKGNRLFSANAEIKNTTKAKQ